MIMFFILGYLLLSCLFAAMESAMKEAETKSQVQGLIVIIPMISIFYGYAYIDGTGCSLGSNNQLNFF